MKYIFLNRVDQKMYLGAIISRIYDNKTLLYYRIIKKKPAVTTYKFRELDVSKLTERIKRTSDPAQQKILRIVERELTRGSKVIICEDGQDRIIHYSCLGKGKVWKVEMGLFLNVPEGEQYIYNCSTIPEHTKKGLFTAAITHILDNYGDAYISCLDKNRKSISVIMKFEPVYLGSIRKIEILNRFRNYKNTTGLEFTGADTG